MEFTLATFIIKQEHRMYLRHIILAAAAALAATAVPAAQAHAKLETSLPAAASTLDSAPKVIRLQFNEALEPAFSTVKLSDATNADIALPTIALDKSDPKAIVATLPPLRSGEYQVRWTTMAHDGHKSKGSFTFRIK